MLIRRRWEREKELMRYHFPNFMPFADPPWFGFQGTLYKNGREFKVVIESREDRYPEWPPSVYMEPRIGPRWRTSLYQRPDPELCVNRDWSPALSSFNSTTFLALGYLHEYA